MPPDDGRDLPLDCDDRFGARGGARVAAHARARLDRLDLRGMRSHVRLRRREPRATLLVRELSSAQLAAARQRLPLPHLPEIGDVATTRNLGYVPKYFLMKRQPPRST